MKTTLWVSLRPQAVKPIRIIAILYLGCWSTVLHMCNMSFHDDQRWHLYVPQDHNEPKYPIAHVSTCHTIHITMTLCTVAFMCNMLSHLNTTSGPFGVWLQCLISVAALRFDDILIVWSGCVAVSHSSSRLCSMLKALIMVSLESISMSAIGYDVL